MNSHSPEKFADWDLYWTAFCYVADDLSESARKSFEKRLDHDQVAREMVAVVVEQMQDLNQALLPQTLTPPVSASAGGKVGRGKWFSDWRSIPWLATGAALLLSLGLWAGYFLGQAKPVRQLGELQPIVAPDEPTAATPSPNSPAAEDPTPVGSDFEPGLLVGNMMNWNVEFHPDIFEGDWELVPVSFDILAQDAYKTVSLDENFYWMVEAFASLYGEQESRDDSDDLLNDLFYYHGLPPRFNQ